MSSKRLNRRPLQIRDILDWATRHREATGHWPTKASGLVLGARFETWLAIDHALRDGLRGQPGGNSLARLLDECKGARNIHDLPPLDPRQVLQWADEHRRRTGAWPTAKSGPIPQTGGENWRGIDTALRSGSRGLPTASSLPRFLAQHRGHRNRKQLPPLSPEQVLAWADAHYQRSGTWPHARCGVIGDALGETWLAVDMALRKGQRGLSPGSSLARLLAERRGVANHLARPELSVEAVLGWAEAWHRQHGTWPHVASGPIPEAPGETWNAVQRALVSGSRGLPGGLSLAQLLARERGVRNPADLPRLSRRRILAWADAHRRRTGQWPTRDSGPIPEAAGDDWQAVDRALREGSRGLRGGSSLVRLLAQHRQRRNRLDLPRLSKKKIVAWADAHRQRTGSWPNVNSGAVAEAPGERWDLIDNALREGQRGLAAGSSLLQLLVRKRGVRDPLHLPPLTEEQILGWADAHRQRTGAWPQYQSGAIGEVPGETWSGVDSALRQGRRGLAAGSSLAKLLAARRRTGTPPIPAGEAMASP
jgi:hypothetical protein